MRWIDPLVVEGEEEENSLFRSYKSLQTLISTFNKPTDTKLTSTELPLAKSSTQKHDNSPTFVWNKDTVCFQFKKDKKRKR